MRQLSCTAPGTVEWQEVPEPRLQGDAEALVRPLIVVDAGLTPPGLRYAIRATAPEGTCQSVSFYAGGDMAMPLGRLYTLGIRFFVGRAHAATLLPEVMPLIAQGRLRPQEVTTRVVDWEEAPAAYLEPAIKLVVRRS
jgi:threonine dehydrogenase-like Zn-dependent dehydrogenase